MSEARMVKKNTLPDDWMASITACARRFGVDAVWLFGSVLEDPVQAKDIDLAVEGLGSREFLDFYGELMDALPKPVDLVDLSEEPPIEPIVRDEGIRIYER